MSYKFNGYCRKFTLVVSFVLLCLVGRSQYNFSSVDKLLSDNQKMLGGNLVALIYRDGKIIYQKQMGDFTLKTKSPVAGSSKWLTAALVMTFVEEGKISLDDKVGKYLPIFEQYGKKNITIFQCLSQQTGIADNEKKIVKMFELQKNKFESLEATVNFFAQKEAVARPGEVFNDGNIGLDIAGRVLEVVSKKKFEVLAKQRIFTPLNMRYSSFAPEENAADPSDGAVSTASDYLNFLTMILDKGMYMGTRILRDSSIAAMQTIQTKDVPKKFAPKISEGLEYGLGEWIEAADDKDNSTVVSCPGLFGTWPIVDKCRNYACILFVKARPGEVRKEFYLQLKRTIDEQMPGGCK